MDLLGIVFSSLIKNSKFSISSLFSPLSSFSGYNVGQILLGSRLKDCYD